MEKNPEISTLTLFYHPPVAPTELSFWGQEPQRVYPDTLQEIFQKELGLGGRSSPPKTYILVCRFWIMANVWVYPKIQIWIKPNVWFYPLFANEGVGFRGRLLAPSSWVLFENFFQGFYLDPFGHLPSKRQLPGCNRGEMTKGQSRNFRVFDHFQWLSPLKGSVILTPHVKTLELEFLCQARRQRGT